MANGELDKTTRAVTDSLADVLERVLDKGIVIVGDIKIQLADVDLLTIKIRLLVASVDKAEKIGIDWWKSDAFLSSEKKAQELEKENKRLLQRLERLEQNSKKPDRRKK